VKTLSILLCVIVFIIAFGSRMVWLQSHGVNFTPDSLEYLNIAKNLTAGTGYQLDIKFHYYRNFPVAHSAWGERPPLYPLILAGLLIIDNSPANTAILNSFFPAINTLLCFMLCYRLFRHRLAAFLGALLFSFNPWLFENSLGFHSEQPLITLTYLFLLLLPQVSGKNERWPVLGLISGASILLRGNGIVLVFSGIIYILFHRWPGKLRRLFLFIIPVILLWSILPINTYLSQGEAFYDIHSSHYCLPRYDIAIWHGYNYDYPSSSEYISTHFQEILSIWGMHTAKYLYDLINPWLLFILSPLVLFAFTAGPGRRPALILLLLTAINLLLAISFWSVYAPRFLLYPLALLIPLSLRGFRPLQKRLSPFKFQLLLVLVLGGLLTAWVVKDDNLLEQYLTRQVNGPHAEANYRPLIGRLPAAALPVFAATDPWIVSYVTNRPAAIIPEFTDAAMMQSWLKEFRFTHIVLDRFYTEYGRQFKARWVPMLLETGQITPVFSDNRLDIYKLENL